jgi:two-component system chemotaxis sensor kinase CheA
MSDDLEMDEILKVFFEECAEGLQAMESGLLTLDGGGDRDTIDTIFRAAHSIKGGAGMFGFMEISQFTHAVETLLDQMRAGKRAVTPDAVQVLFQSVDVMREMTNLAEARKPIVSPNADALTSLLAQILAQPPGGTAQATPMAAAPAATVAPAAIAAPPEPPAVGWCIDFRPHTSLFKTCNDPLRIFRELETLGPVQALAHAENVPSLADMDPTQCYLSWRLTLAGAVQQSQIAEAFEWVDANSSIDYQPLSPAQTTAAAPPAPPAPLSPAGLTPAPPAPLAPAPLSPAVAVAVAVSVAVADPPLPVASLPIASATAASAPAAPPLARANVDAGSFRVATEKVDALINLVGELVITQSMLGRFSEHYDPGNLESLRRGLSHLTRNTRDLQESVLKIRMLPISFSFNRFPRLVHELSRKLGKKVELRLAGESTELDKIVLEKIGDPLVHLVRNSLDHGLETPENRRAAGKSETGILELNAFHEGGSVIIEVKDDGAGLNTARILAKARERGLVDPDVTPTTEQIYNLIFAPGFSTADTVSDVSGRGVGMDVVRRNINDLGGHVYVSSNPGRGSAIRIRLPLTLAILEGQMLRVGPETYVISLVSIIETVQPRRAHVQSIAGRAEVFKHRDEYLPIIRLHELFEIEPDSRDVSEGLLVVAESDGKRVAILVDELLAQQQVVIKSLDTNFRQVPGLAGATIHGDGRVALILDVPSLVGKFLEGAGAAIDFAA